MSEQRFVMMMGLAGSGKSTFSKQIMEGRENVVYLSSDELREELTGDENNQDANADVFAEMLKRTKEALKEGKDVIYDATNLNRKRRRGLLSQLPRHVHKAIAYMATTYENTVSQNSQRERQVPIEVIQRMYKNLQIPICSEGWNTIEIVYDRDTLDAELLPQITHPLRACVLVGKGGYELMRDLGVYFKEFSDIFDMAQDSKWHSFSVSRHTYYVYKHVLDNYEAKDNLDKEVMLWAGLLHDTGKYACKSFYNRKGEETRYANFIGHEFVSSQIAVSILKRLGYGDIFIHKVATLIQFHMYLLNEDANKKKLKQYVGEELYEKLVFLRDADTLAH